MPLAVSSHARLLTTKSVNLPIAMRQESSSYNTQEIAISEESSATISLQKSSDTTLLINTQTKFASDNCWSLHIDLTKTKGKLRSFMLNILLQGNGSGPGKNALWPPAKHCKLIFAFGPDIKRIIRIDPTVVGSCTFSLNYDQDEEFYVTCTNSRLINT